MLVFCNTRESHEPRRYGPVAPIASHWFRASHVRQVLEIFRSLSPGLAVPGVNVLTLKALQQAEAVWKLRSWAKSWRVHLKSETDGLMGLDRLCQKLHIDLPFTCYLLVDFCYVICAIKSQERHDNALAPSKRGLNFGLKHRLPSGAWSAVDEESEESWLSKSRTWRIFTVQRTSVPMSMMRRI